MANENSFPTQVGNRGYYGIDGEGRIFRKATAQEIEKGGKDIISHVKKKGANEGQIEMRRTFLSLFGKVSAFWVKTSQDFGDSLIVEL
jgi:hypothetical protein